MPSSTEMTTMPKIMRKNTEFCPFCEKFHPVIKIEETKIFVDKEFHEILYKYQYCRCLRTYEDFETDRQAEENLLAEEKARTIE